jgi:hypothetical protein
VQTKSLVVAAILILGEEPERLETQLADLMIGWQISTSVSREAIPSIHSA